MFEIVMIKSGYYEMDCMDLMRELPDKSIDLAIVDPPTGQGEDGESNHSRSCMAKTTKFQPKKWDKSRPNQKYFTELQRVSKRQIIWCGAYFADLLPPSPGWIIWDKDNGATDFGDAELAWSNVTGAPRLFKFKWQGMLQGNMKHKETRIHPTQKPKALYRWLMRKYWKEGQTIIDTHVGSGNSLAVFEEFGATYWSTELDPDYYRDSLVNIAKHKAFFKSRTKIEIKATGGQMSIFDKKD